MDPRNCNTSSLPPRYGEYSPSDGRYAPYGTSASIDLTQASHNGMDAQYSNLLNGPAIPPGWMSSQPFNAYAPFMSNASNMTGGGSSQMEDNPVEYAHTNEGQTDEVMQKKGGRKKNFSDKEDLILISAWTNVTLDAVVGTNQSLSTYWGRIYDYYHEHKDFPSDRSKKSLTIRWQSIQAEVTKYTGCLAQVEGRNKSGTTVADQLQEAASLYESNENKKFVFMHCYNALRQNQKWKSLQCNKKQKTCTGASPGSSRAEGINVDLDDDAPGGSGNASTRPIGTKAAKSQRRRSTSSDHESAMKASTDSINSQIMENENKRQEMLKQHQMNHEKGLQERHEQQLAAKHRQIEMFMHIEEKKLEQKERLKLIEIEAEDRRRRNEKKMELEARELDMIMQLDLNKLNDEAKEYYEKRKKKLLTNKELLD